MIDQSRIETRSGYYMRVGQRNLMIDHRMSLTAHLLVPKFIRKLIENSFAVQKRARVEPCFRYHRRLMQLLLDHIAGWSTHPVLEVLRVRLLDHAEAPKFSFRVIVITVVVLVRADEAVTGDSVSRLSLCDAVNRKVEL